VFEQGLSIRRAASGLGLTPAVLRARPDSIRVQAVKQGAAAVSEEGRRRLADWRHQRQQRVQAFAEETGPPEPARISPGQTLRQRR
jgi:hypothetical protein